MTYIRDSRGLLIVVQPREHVHKLSDVTTRIYRNEKKHVLRDVDLLDILSFETHAT